MTEYIEREAALALVRPDVPEDEKAAITIATAKKLIRSIIQRAPTADVEPVRHGRWIHEILEDLVWGVPYDKWSCSICRFSVSNPIDKNYCPYCGAKMDEVE